MQTDFCNMTKKGLLIVCMVLGLTACGEYQQLLKSTDPELKYQKALMYFNDEQYVKAQTLLDDITTDDIQKSLQVNVDIVKSSGYGFLDSILYRNQSSWKR